MSMGRQIETLTRMGYDVMFSRGDDDETRCSLFPGEPSATPQRTEVTWTGRNAEATLDVAYDALMVYVRRAVRRGHVSTEHEWGAGKAHDKVPVLDRHAVMEQRRD